MYLVVSLPIRRVPGVLMMSRCRNIVLLTPGFFYVSTFTILTSFSLLFSCRLSFPIVGLKIFSFPTYALKSHNWIFICYLGKWSKTCSKSSHKLFFESSLFFSLGACTFRTMIFYQLTLRTIYDTLLLTNSTLLTADTVLWYTKKSCSQLMIIVFFPP